MRMNKRAALVPLLIAIAGAALARSSSARTLAQASPAPTPALGELEITDKARIALEKLPYYGPFDLVAFQVHGTVVTLSGWVYQGINKEEAEKAVKRIPGVTRVVNKIEALPASPSDDRIRWETFRKVYSDDFLQKYGTPMLGLTTGRWGRRYWGRGLAPLAAFPGSEPIGNYAIHIIVKGGRIALYGTVNSEADKIKAGMDAKDVSGVFGVDNQLQVVQD
jgi:hyperosmotically inducible protein